MKNQERSKQVNHWKSVIKKYNSLQDKRPLTLDERQQRDMAQYKIDELYTNKIYVV